MKTRNGFVSNSSSSSFIIGIAKVADEKRLKQILKKVPKAYRYEYVLGTFDEIQNSDLMSRVCRHITTFDSKTKTAKTENRVERIMVEAPVNDCIVVSVDTNNWNRDIVTKYRTDKKGDVWAKDIPAKWFAICVGNDEGDGGDSPFYQWTKWQSFKYRFVAQPINWMSRNLLYPIIKILNKIFKKNWFYPYIIIGPKSGYDKVKDHTFFKEEWQREIVKAFEEADGVSKYHVIGRYNNAGIFSDEYGCYTYKIGACRNG